MTTRKAVTVPAAGATSEPILIAGDVVVVESTSVSAPADVATLHVDSPDGPELPAYPQAKYVRPFERLYLKGTTAAAGTTIYLLIVSGELDVWIPNTPTHPA